MLWRKAAAKHSLATKKIKIVFGVQYIITSALTGVIVLEFNAVFVFSKFMTMIYEIITQCKNSNAQA